MTKLFRATICASLLLAGAAALVHAAESRPNILFLFADDWAWPHASCLGTPVVKTPTFDRIAKEGVLFRNAHTVKDLDARLMALLNATDDPRATGGGDEFDGYGTAQPAAKRK